MTKGLKKKKKHTESTGLSLIYLFIYLLGANKRKNI